MKRVAIGILGFLGLLVLGMQAHGAATPNRPAPAANSADAAQDVASERRKKFDEALEAKRRGQPESVVAERKLLAAPEDLGVRLDAARAYLAEARGSPSKLDAASEHVDVVLAAQPNNVAARMLAGQIAIRRGQPALALSHYRAAVAADPNNASAFLGLGESYSRLGNEEQASTAYAEFRRLRGALMSPAAGADAKAQPGPRGATRGR